MDGALPSAPMDLFKPARVGGRRGAPRKQEDAPAEEPEILAIPAEESPPAAEKPTATLSEPAWVKPETCFHEEAEVSVKLTLPEEKKHLTRIMAELHANTPEDLSS